MAVPIQARYLRAGMLLVPDQGLPVRIIVRVDLELGEVVVRMMGSEGKLWEDRYELHAILAIEDSGTGY